MALISSGATADLLTVDPTSKAARVTRYAPDGTVLDGELATFRVVLKAAAPPASATAPFLVIQGSGTKTIKIQRVRYEATAATGAAGDLWVARFTAISGGTSSAPTVSAADSTDSPATATLANYTVVPTTATLGDSFFHSERYETVTAAVTVTPQVADVVFGADDRSKPLVIRGASQWCGIGISAAGTTPVADLIVEWTES